MELENKVLLDWILLFADQYFIHFRRPSLTIPASKESEEYLLDKQVVKEAPSSLSKSPQSISLVKQKTQK